MKMKKFTILLCPVFFVVCMFGFAHATPITNNFGLSSPSSTITFDEIIFPQGTVIDTQYASYGATFTSGLKYDAQGVSAFPGITGHYIGNFNPVVNPFSIFFTFAEPLTEAAFGMATNPATTTFTAYLNGSAVETFSASTTSNNSNAGYYGFTGILFDEISVLVSSNLALIDNIQMGGTPVPEPATCLLFLFGLTGMIGVKKKLS